MEPQKIVIRKHGGPERLRLETVEMAPLDAQDVRIEVSYAGVNWADVMMRMGLYPEAPPPPFTPGYEVVGTVLERGAEAKGVRKGDRVVAGTRFGGYASIVDVPADQAVKLPRMFPDQAAAALPVNAMTAWAALVGHGRVQKGDKVLVHGGAGGVGLIAVALAKMHGADVYATCGSDEKIAFLENEAGVAKAFNYRTPWRKRVVQSVGRMDLILDPVGGKNLHESRRALRPFGQVVNYGVSDIVGGRSRNLIRAAMAIRQMRFSSIQLMHRNVSIAGVNLLTLWGEHDDLDKALKDIASAMVRGKMPMPRVDSIFPLAEAGAAHEHLHQRKNIGKVLLQP